MTDNIKMAGELLSAAKQILAADYVYDPSHKKKPRGGGWHKTEKGWSNIPKTKLAPIDFGEGKKSNSSNSGYNGFSSREEYDSAKKKLFDAASNVDIPLFDKREGEPVDQAFRVATRPMLKTIKNLTTNDLDDFHKHFWEKADTSPDTDKVLEAELKNPGASEELLQNVLENSEGWTDDLIYRHPNATNDMKHEIERRRG